jgi:gliding motility-associated-like protein
MARLNKILSFQLIWLSLIATGLHAQTVYTPVAITGFNQDVVADTGKSSAAATTTMIDGNINIANHVIYSENFASVNGLAGGIYNSGAIVNGASTYQLASYAGKNALYLSKNANIDSTLAEGMLTLTTPAVYSRLSLLLFSTEGNSQINVNLNFTDGTTERAVTNATVNDWYNNGGAVYAGFGRIDRPSGTIDGVGSNPRFYKQDILVSCNSQDKFLQSITIADTSSSTFSRVVVMAVSGAAIQPLLVTPTVIPARCGSTNNGVITLDVTGGVKPFTYVWNTTPVQTTPTASGLSTGTYTCIITDSNKCVRTFSNMVPLVTPAPVAANALKNIICSNEATTLFADTSAGIPGTYTWNPGGYTGSSVVVAPGITTTYTLNAEDIYGCTSSATVQITVKVAPVAAFTVAPEVVCLGTDQSVWYTGYAGSTATYNWNSFAGADVQSGSGAGPYTIQFKKGGTYTLQLQVSENGCASPVVTQTVTVNAPLVSPVVRVAAVTSSSITFGWEPVPGATGYIVSVNGGVYITPTSGSLGITHHIVNLQPMEKITISVIALGVESCMNSMEGKFDGTTLADEIFIPNSFTPNGDGRNELFKAYGNIIAGINMKIFNQWGQLIYETSDVQNGWDGRHKGRLQPMGVYVYAIRIKLNNGEEVLRKGTVNLLH